jgi:hypothetical protein
MNVESEELDLSGSDKSWSLDQMISSGIMYESLVENYGEPAVQAVLQKLELDRHDICLGDNTKIILRILNGEI